MGSKGQSPDSEIRVASAQPQGKEASWKEKQEDEQTLREADLGEVS